MMPAWLWLWLWLWLVGDLAVLIPAEVSNSPGPRGLDLRDNQVSAALVATQNGITADQKATTILTTQLGQCRH